MNLHVPLHTLAIDGVFEKTDDGGVCVDETPPPWKDDVEEVARRVRDRALRWLRRPSYLDERASEERGNEPREPDALQGCMQRALAGGAAAISIKLQFPFPLVNAVMRTPRKTSGAHHDVPLYTRYRAWLVQTNR